MLFYLNFEYSTPHFDTMLEKSYAFLELLKKNNHREWYHANKKLYQEAQEEFEQITEIMLYETSKFDKSLLGLIPKDCIFRIFRDVRFSKDKSPYKTNFGAFLTPGGKKSVKAGYYLHVEPGGSFVAAGIYMPPSEVLRAIRSDIVEHFQEYLEIVESPDIVEEFGGVSGEKLKTAPKGFDKEFPGIEHLKFKNYGLIAMRSDEQIRSEESFSDIMRLFRLANPFVFFLNEAAGKV
ncbi:MAG: DUF2461 domain-containing protein [Bacteroidales bacterium]|nr:DUF2461 domain-containing protein [Bacteroidales bacterium]